MIGEKLGSFRIEAEIGSGAMGTVYRGLNEVKNRLAAVKVISAEQIGKGKGLARFEREAELLKSFRHPNIVKYQAFGRSAGIYYYAMEYVEGPTLDRILRDRGPLGWREVVSLGIQLCDALQYIHENGVVHRDLKPSNLMINEQGQLKLTDFGIAKDLDGTALTGTGRTLGTAAYMAPEQIRGIPEVSHKTDLYALGIVFYQMLVGEPPYGGTTAVVLMHAHLNEPPKRPSLKIHEIPKALDDLVVQLMAKDPNNRPWDALAVGEILRGLDAKATRNESIKMVWPDPSQINASAATVDADSAFGGDSPPKPARSKKKKRRKSIRGMVEVAGLLAALAVLSGLILYIVLPPGAGYLYRKAETLNASEDPLDWIRARDEYLDPLDDRFPDHPYKEKTRAWRDRIDLRDATRRSEVLERTNLAAFSKPQTEAEALYAETFQESQAAAKLGHDQDALESWKKMAAQLAEAGPKDRGWLLLAESRADALAKNIQRRRKTVADLLAKAKVPDPSLGPDAARDYSTQVYKDIVERFGRYTDTADLVAQARAGLPPEPEKPADKDKEKETTTPGP